VPDADGDSTDWIRSGTEAGDVNVSTFIDPNEVYENVLGGTWAAFRVTANTGIIGAVKPNDALVNVLNRWDYMAGVDVVFTKDKSLWSRCVVFETGEDTMPTVGTAKRLDRRNQASVDKDGNPATIGSGPSTNPNDPNYISDKGMGWFPGYAINVETGERLNIAFGENSALDYAYCKDMIWNPTSEIGPDANGRTVWGGMHTIWVFNRTGAGVNDVPIYDDGTKIRSLIESGSTAAKRNVFKAAIWASIPLVEEDRSLIETTTRVRLRVNENYNTFVSAGQTPVNGGNPMYEFTIDGALEASTGVTEVAKSALDFIRVVPNPYYAYSSYEKTRRDQLDNRVRITNLPNRCTVSIYTINGTLVRQYKRDVSSDVSDGQAVNEGVDFNQATTLDWDMKNTAGITVASGMYIIHIDAGNLGEKVVKWFGIMRPIDLDSF